MPVWASDPSAAFFGKGVLRGAFFIGFIAGPALADPDLSGR
jgi:hypothetical protein